MPSVPDANTVARYVASTTPEQLVADLRRSLASFALAQEIAAEDFRDGRPRNPDIDSRLTLHSDRADAIVTAGLSSKPHREALEDAAAAAGEGSPLHNWVVLAGPRLTAEAAAQHQSVDSGVGL